jgi:hypothetical protein
VTNTNHVLVFNERHLRHVLSSYVDYYHRTRTHFSLDKNCPDPRFIQPPRSGVSSSYRKSADCTIATIASRHRVHKRRARPRAVDREQPGPTTAAVGEEMQPVTKGEVLSFQNRPAPGAASENKNHETCELRHARQHYGGQPKTLAFSARAGVFGKHNPHAGARFGRVPYSASFSDTASQPLSQAIGISCYERARSPCRTQHCVTLDRFAS